MADSRQKRDRTTISVPPEGPACFADFSLPSTANRTESFVDTEKCGFAIEQTQTESGNFTVYFKDGVRTKAIVHNVFEATLTANGTTLVERDRWNAMFYGEASEQGEVDEGSLVHIQGPGSLLIHEAGKIVSIPTGSFSYEKGRHPDIVGAICAALHA